MHAARIIAAIALSACTQPAFHGPAEAFTFAAHSDRGVVALTFDGAVATVYRSGENVASYAADSRESALWGWTSPEAGTVTAPRLYDRALSSHEVGALASCDWTPDLTLRSCSGVSGCDCDGPGPIAGW